MYDVLRTTFHSGEWTDFVIRAMSPLKQQEKDLRKHFRSFLNEVQQEGSYESVVKTAILDNCARFLAFLGVVSRGYFSVRHAGFEYAELVGRRYLIRKALALEEIFYYSFSGSSTKKYRQKTLDRAFSHDAQIIRRYQECIDFDNQVPFFDPRPEYPQLLLDFFRAGYMQLVDFLVLRMFYRGYQYQEIPEDERIFPRRDEIRSFIRPCRKLSTDTEQPGTRHYISLDI